MAVVKDGVLATNPLHDVRGVAAVGGSASPQRACRDGKGIVEAVLEVGIELPGVMCAKRAFRNEPSHGPNGLSGADPREKTFVLLQRVLLVAAPGRVKSVIHLHCGTLLLRRKRQTVEIPIQD